MVTSFKVLQQKIIIRLRDRVCETTEELIESEPFARIVRGAVRDLMKRESILLGIFGEEKIGDEQIVTLLAALKFLSKLDVSHVLSVVPAAERLLSNKALLAEFVEHLYNYWRSFERFIICDSEGEHLDKRPYRTFNATVETLTHLVRQAYRDIQENITGRHPNVYRQVSAGAEIATIAIPASVPFPTAIYGMLNEIPVIRQILLYPPLILDPPDNTRKGMFQRVDRNPLELIDLTRDEWLCYPAKVGAQVILVYFHEKYFDLGFTLSNLFELATADDLKRAPDAVYLFGVPGNTLDAFSDFPTVFYDDERNNMLVAACPNGDVFGYFGYLKKMILTLHNIRVMKEHRMPFHGALVRLLLKTGQDKTVLFIGDTGAGKSESLEALRHIGSDIIKDLIIIADDMGSLDIKDDRIIGYGTETGAFLRLDDLMPGYAFGQLDRSIIMSANKVNARIVFPVTTFDTVVKGTAVDYVLYANNYDEIDAEHPILERFETAEYALRVFREGTVMSKGTTSATGLTHSYFANIFGPPQYKDEHEAIAKKYFAAFFSCRVYVGQFRTRLGIPGKESTGPHDAAVALLKELTHGG